MGVFDPVMKWLVIARFRCRLGHGWCRLWYGHPGWCEVAGGPTDPRNDGFRFDDIFRQVGV